MAKKVTTFTDDQIAALANGVREKSKADRAAEKANEQRAGAYTSAIVLAVEMGADFDGAMQALFKRIRTEGPLAKSFTAKRNDKGDGWIIPSALSSAKSVLVGAMKVGVPLVDDEGSPRPFTVIRSEKRDVEQAIAKAEQSEHANSRDTLVDGLREFAKTLADIKPSEVDAAMGQWCDSALLALLESAQAFNEIAGDVDEEEVEDTAEVKQAA